MSMSKRDFIALADAIRYEYETVEQGFHIAQGAQRTYLQGRKEGIESLMAKIADTCQLSNPRFMRDRWLGYIAGENGKNGGKR